MLKIGLYGARGRMGQMIKSLLQTGAETGAEAGGSGKNTDTDGGAGTATLAAEFSRGGDLGGFFEKSELIIDFSSPAGTAALLDFALASTASTASSTSAPVATPPCPALLIGTTGLAEADFEKMKILAGRIPLFYASNFSLGVAVLGRLVALAAGLLPDFEVELVETHHRHKKDSPSGTALTLAQAVAAARGRQLGELMRLGAQTGENGTGQRAREEIILHSLRGGDVAGRHTVGLYGEGEFLEFTHQASSRLTFARGALAAARWLAGQKNGLYSMNNFLGL